MFHQRVLCQVRVLKFIHEHVPESLCVLLAHGWHIFQQARGVNQQVIKVHGVAGDQSFLIFNINAFDNFIAVGVDRVLFSADQFILCARDRGVYAGGAI